MLGAASDAPMHSSISAPPVPVTITATAFGARGQLLAANQAGLVMALQGDRLAPILAEPLPPLTGLLALPGGGILVLSIQGALQVPAKP